MEKYVWGVCASDVRQQHDWIKPALSIKSTACLLALDFKKQKISIKWIFTVKDFDILGTRKVTKASLS